MNIDPRKIQLSERDVEDWLWENPQAVGLSRWIARQYEIPSGRLDLLGFNGQNAVVVEVKNAIITSEALTQVCRYAYDVKNIIDNRTGFSEDDIYVAKFVIGIGSPSTQVLQEAEALDVTVKEFQVHFSMDVSTWNLSSTFRQERQTKWEILSGNDNLYYPFDSFEEEESDNTNQSDIPDVFKDFIDKQNQESSDGE